MSDYKLLEKKVKRQNIFLSIQSVLICILFIQDYRIFLSLGKFKEIFDLISTHLESISNVIERLFNIFILF